jgi:hypothetical protein
MLLTMLLLRFDRGLLLAVGCNSSQSFRLWYRIRPEYHGLNRLECVVETHARVAKHVRLAACTFLPTNSIVHSLIPYAHSSPHSRTRFPSFRRSHVVVVGGSEESWIVGRFRSRMVQAAAAESIAC